MVSHQHTLPFSTHGPREPESCKPAVHSPNPPLSHLCTAPHPHPSVSITLSRGVERLSRLCTQPSLTPCPQSGLVTGTCSGRHADPRVQAHSTCRWAHMHTNAHCPLAHLDVHHTEHRHTCLPAHTQQHMGHTLTHAQVASYDAHTLQTNMHRFSCLSCDSQMVGFSQRATI